MISFPEMASVNTNWATPFNFLIERFEIYRRLAGTESEFTLIKRLANDYFDWEDYNLLPYNKVTR